jgi:hypothetical protein
MHVIGTAPFQFKTKLSDYGSSTTAQMQLILMTFTSLLWVFSMIMMFIAAIIYVPLLCHIKGNLKEYVCHKIDKRQVIDFTSEAIAV